MEKEFEKALRDAVRQCQQLNPPYNPIRFIQMLNEHGAVETAKMLLENHEGWQEGFGTLYMKEGLDLTIEAYVVKCQFKGLFSEEEIAEAQKRLKAVDKS